MAILFLIHFVLLCLNTIFYFLPLYTQSRSNTVPLQSLKKMIQTVCFSCIHLISPQHKFVKFSLLLFVKGIYDDYYFYQNRTLLASSQCGFAMRQHCWYCGSHHIQPVSTPTTRCQLTHLMPRRVFCMWRRRASLQAPPRLPSRVSFQVSDTLYNV